MANDARSRHATIWRIAELVEMDILRPSNAQRRNRAFQAHQVLNALHTGLDEVLR